MKFGIRKNLFFFLFLAFISVVFVSCIDTLPLTREKYLKEMTLIVYMIADNDLDYFSDGDINEMEEVGSTEGIDIVVVRDRLSISKPGGVNVYWISKDNDRGKIKSPIMISYGEMDMCNSNTLRKVLEDITNLFPSTRYGLVLWSHGSGMVPKWYKPQWFGEDVSGGSRFDIRELVEGLKGFEFEFIAFDGCSMADVEIIPYFSGITEYLIFSQVEILAEGYPYHTMLNKIVIGAGEVEERLKRGCAEFLEYYRCKEEEVYKSGSISMVKVENFGEFEKKVSNYISLVMSFVGSNGILSEMSNIQRVSYVYNFKGDLMDLLGRLEKVISNDVVSSVFEEVEESFRSMLLYEGHTEKYLGSMSLSNLNGLNVFLPLVEDTNLIEYYKKTGWYSNSGMFAVY